MSTVQLAGNNIGGTIQGDYGTYTQAADGTFTVDTRDAPAMLKLGMSYLRNATQSYAPVANPRAASAGRIVASATLGVGGLTIANQPDVPRALNIIIGNAASPSLSAGSVAMTYLAADGTTRTDTVNALASPQAGGYTQSTSRGVVKIATIVVAGIAGGNGNYVRVDDTNLIALPSDPNAQDFTLLAEYDGATLQTSSGTVSLTAIGCTSVQTTPTGTGAYSFVYGFVAPST